MRPTRPARTSPRKLVSPAPALLLIRGRSFTPCLSSRPRSSRAGMPEPPKPPTWIDAPDITSRSASVTEWQVLSRIVVFHLNPGRATRGEVSLILFATAAENDPARRAPERHGHSFTGEEGGTKTHVQFAQAVVRVLLQLVLQHPVHQAKEGRAMQDRAVITGTARRCWGDVQRVAVLLVLVLKDPVHQAKEGRAMQDRAVITGTARRCWVDVQRVAVGVEAVYRGLLGTGGYADRAIGLARRGAGEQRG